MDENSAKQIGHTFSKHYPPEEQNHIDLNDYKLNELTGWTRVVLVDWQQQFGHTLEKEIVQEEKQNMQYIIGALNDISPLIREGNGLIVDSESSSVNNSQFFNNDSQRPIYQLFI